MTTPTGIIYLIQPEELLLTNRYKIGCSGKSNLSRLSGYKKNSRYLCVIECIYPYTLENKIKEEFNKKYKLIAGKEFFEGLENEILNNFIKIIQEYNDEISMKNITDEDIEEMDKIVNEREKAIPSIVLGMYEVLDDFLSVPRHRNIKFISENVFEIYIGDNKWDTLSFYEIKQNLLNKVIESMKASLELNPNSDHSHFIKFIINDFDKNIGEYLCCHNDKLINLLKNHCS